MNSNTFEFFFFLNYYYLYNWKLFLPNITTELACNSRLILWKCFSETKKIRQTKIIVNVYKGARTRWRDSTAYKGWARNKNVRDTPSGKERVAEKYKFDRDRQTDIQANRQTDRQRQTLTDEQTDNLYFSNPVFFTCQKLHQVTSLRHGIFLNVAFVTRGTIRLVFFSKRA